MLRGVLSRPVFRRITVVAAAFATMLLTVMSLSMAHADSVAASNPLGFNMTVSVLNSRGVVSPTGKLTGVGQRVVLQFGLSVLTSTAGITKPTVTAKVNSTTVSPKCPSSLKAKSSKGPIVVYCSVTYKVTKADMTKGALVIKATATGTFKGKKVTQSLGPLTIGRAGVTIGASAGSLARKALMTTSSPPALLTFKSGVLSRDGSTIKYTFTVKNTGKTTLSHVKFTYSFKPAKAADPSCSPSTIKPGKTATCTVTYKVKKADKGKTITATIKVSASKPNGSKVSITGTGSVKVPAPKPVCTTKAQKATAQCKSIK